MSAVRGICALALVETLRILRFRTSFTLLIVVPAMQVLLFGHAIRPSPAQLTVVVAAPTPADAAPIRQALSGVDELTLSDELRTPGAAAAAVRRGEALLGIEVQPVRPGHAPAPPRIVADATNAGLTATAIAGIEAAYWRGLAGPANTAAPVVERLYNRGSRVDWTFLPALIGVVVMIAMIMLGALSLAREREGGTWEALLALAIPRPAMLLGKLLPYVVIGTVQGLLVLGVGAALFAVPTRGSLIGLIALLPLFSAACLTLGYAIAMRANTQIAALQGVVAFYLPSMLLSGFLYPFETLPAWAQAIGNLLPLTHFIRAARGALLRGDDAAAVIAHGWPIAAFLVVAAVIALLAHRRSVD